MLGSIILIASVDRSSTELCDRPCRACWADSVGGARRLRKMHLHCPRSRPRQRCRQRAKACPTCGPLAPRWHRRRRPRRSRTRPQRLPRPVHRRASSSWARCAANPPPRKDRPSRSTRLQPFRQLRYSDKDRDRRIRQWKAEPADAAFMLQNTRHIHGFYGASSMERLPVETALAAQTRAFKAIGRAGGGS